MSAFIEIDLIETYFYRELIDTFEYWLSVITTILAKIFMLVQSYFSIKKVIHIVGVYKKGVMSSGDLF